MTSRHRMYTSAAIAALVAIGSASHEEARAEPVCVPPPSGMTHWWPADGDANDVVGVRHGTLEGGAGFSAGEVGQAFQLDGIDDHVRVENDASFSLTGSFTIDAWLKLDAYSAEFAPIVSKWDDLGFVNERSYFLGVFGDRLRFDVSSDGGFLGASSSRLVVSSVAIPLDVWTHVAGVFDAEGQALRVYVDGVENGGTATPFSTVFVNEEPLLIGAGDLGSNIRDFTAGAIDEVEFFDRALTKAEIASIAAAGSAGKVRTIEIDVKPGGEPNPINLGSQGSVPAAILTTSTFDAATLDVESLTFAGAPVKTKKNGTPQAALEDVDGDGDLDLVAHFATQAMTELSSSSTEAVFTGETADGRCVAGSDDVEIVPGD